MNIKMCVSTSVCDAGPSPLRYFSPGGFGKEKSFTRRGKWFRLVTHRLVFRQGYILLINTGLTLCQWEPLAVQY